MRARRADPLRRFLRSDLIRHGALVFTATTLVNVFNYVFHFAISRKLGVVGYGTLSSLIATLAIVSVPATILNIVVVKFAAEFHALSEGSKLRRLSYYVIRLAISISSVVFIGGLIVKSAIASYLSIPNDAAILVALAIVCFNLILPGARGILQGTQDFGHFAMSVGLEAVLKAILGIAFVYAGLGTLGAMAGFACGTCVSLLYTLVVMRLHFSNEHVRLSLDLRRLFVTTAGVALATVTLTLFGFMDLVLVKHFFDPRTAGIYSALSLTGKILVFVVGFIPIIVLPKAAAMASAGRTPTPILKSAGIGTIAFSACGLAAFYLQPTLVVRLVSGVAFLPASQYVFRYGIVMTLVAATSLVATYKIGLHRFDFLPPLVLIVVAEIVCISLVHRTLWDVIDILLVGHSVAFLSSIYKIMEPLRVPRAAVLTEAMSMHG